MNIKSIILKSFLVKTCSFCRGFSYEFCCLPTKFTVHSSGPCEYNTNKLKGRGWAELSKLITNSVLYINITLLLVIFYMYLRLLGRPTTILLLRILILYRYTPNVACKVRITILISNIIIMTFFQIIKSNILAYYN